jgi:hypothetical protein
MAHIILPIPAFERKETFTRGGKTYIAVYGINDSGFAYTYIEEAELDEYYQLTVRWIPTKMHTSFDEYGVCRPIQTHWKKTYMSNNKVVKIDPYVNLHMETNHPDMIAFTASLGIKMTPSIINGKIRGIDGFDTQPVFAQDGSRIPDTVYLEDGSVDTVNSYDTNAEPTFTYLHHQPQYAEETTLDTSTTGGTTTSTTETP